MKILVYSAKDFEIPFLEKENADQFQIKYIADRLTAKTAWLALGFDVVSIFSSDDGSSEVLERLSDIGVKYITLRSTGYDNVNLGAAKKLNIQVANAAGYSPYAIAEHAIALLLTLNRKILIADHQVHDYNFSLDNLMGFDLNKKTVGIIGTGRIGGAIAKIMSGFGCQILANDIFENQELIHKYKVIYSDLVSLAQRSDIIFLSVPLTSKTHYMINSEIIGLMKPSVVLINIARGAIVKTKDLIQALELKRITAYGTDVYERESGIFFYDHSNKTLDDLMLKKLIDLPNTLVTPHQAFATKEALTNIAKTTFENIRCWDNKITPKNKLIPLLKNASV